VNCPIPSPFMLINAKVKTDNIPAVTHVDKSARIQTIDDSCGDYYCLLRCFFDLTGLPVLMNTSLNGPGEPIVEKPLQAIKLFINTDLDAMFLCGQLITKVDKNGK